MDEESEAVIVSLRLAWVFLERSVACRRCLFGEVFACVEVLDDGAHGISIAISKDNLAWSPRRKGIDLSRKFWRLEDNRLMRRVGRSAVS